MNKLEKWLLRKLLRKYPLGRIIEFIWADNKRRFYEDNIHGRYDYIERCILYEYDKELEECRKEFA